MICSFLLLPYPVLNTFNNKFSHQINQSYARTENQYNIVKIAPKLSKLLKWITITVITIFRNVDEALHCVPREAVSAWWPNLVWRQHRAVFTHGNEVLGFCDHRYFFRPRPLIWNRGTFSPIFKKKIPLAPRLSFVLPFTLNSRLLRYFSVLTLSQKTFHHWHQIRLKRRGIVKRKHVQSFLSVWNKCLLSGTAKNAWHAGKRQSEQFAVSFFFLQTRRIKWVLLKRVFCYLWIEFITKA